MIRKSLKYAGILIALICAMYLFDLLIKIVAVAMIYVSETCDIPL